MLARTKYIILTVILLVVLAGIQLRAESHFLRADSTLITFLDVGQGDAILIRDTRGRTVLIDAGPKNHVIGALSRNLPAWKRDIDILILTHFDADHITGAFDLFRRYRIGEIWWNGAMPATRGGRLLLKEAHAQGISMNVVRSGIAYAFAKMSLKVIHPDTDLSGTFPEDRNAGSVSVRLDCGDDVTLLAGDAPSETEKDFLEDGDIGDITLLKASHHGSRHSTSEAFLKATTPEYAVISSGRRNHYGHPSSRVLIDLRKMGVRILRTDHDGDITFACDGQRLHYLSR